MSEAPRVHQFLVLGLKPRKYRWWVQSSLIERLAGGEFDEFSEVDLDVEGKRRKFVKGGEAFVGSVEALHLALESSGARPGEVVLVTSESAWKCGKETIEKRVMDPLEEMGFNVGEPKLVSSVVGMEGLEGTIEALLGLLERTPKGDTVLLDLTHGLRIMTFTIISSCLATLRLFLTECRVESVIEGEDRKASEVLDRVAVTYALVGSEVKGVVKGLGESEGAVLDVTGRLLRWRSVDLMAEFLEDPSPTVVEELGELTGGSGSEGLETLRRFARIERTSVPGLAREFLENEPEPPEVPGVPGIVLERVWETFREVFLGDDRDG